MQKFLANSDLHVLVTVVQKKSFAAAADELGVSPAYISKRIRVLEDGIGTPLFHRTSRRIVLTEQGEAVYQKGVGILDSVSNLMQIVGASRQIPSGPLRVSSGFGFGRRVVAPALSQLSQLYPGLQIRFEVFDRVVDVAAEGFDLDLRVGDEVAPHLIAKKLGDNHRILCASPSYIERFGVPADVDDLQSHACLVIKERDHPFGVWRLQCDGRVRAIKVSTPMLSTNNGEIALGWALEGRGILLRSLWNVRPQLENKSLVHILPGCTQPANFWAVYPSRLENSANVRTTVDFMHRYLHDQLDRVARLPAI
uniref:LysR substrate-binding domain-containing protein n=1 Tax=Variovorax sp. BK018 TaxID=3450241 RepID=UPI00403A570D